LQIERGERQREKKRTRSERGKVKNEKGKRGRGSSRKHCGKRLSLSKRMDILTRNVGEKTQLITWRTQQAQQRDEPGRAEELNNSGWPM
jgi:hypothetical protein